MTAEDEDGPFAFIDWVVSGTSVDRKTAERWLNDLLEEARAEERLALGEAIRELRKEARQEAVNVILRKLVSPHLPDLGYAEGAQASLEQLGEITKLMRETMLRFEDVSQVLFHEDLDVNVDAEVNRAKRWHKGHLNDLRIDRLEAEWRRDSASQGS